MYEVDHRDRVVLLEGLPQSCIGAPIPLVLADEHAVVLAYYLEERSDEWDGSTVRMLDPIASDQPIAIVRFDHCMAHMFGPPNDEAFEGHPLAARGLEPYDAFRIDDSSWIRRLERMNSVHQYHDPKRFWELQHLVFAFHDSTFECVCKSFEIRTTRGALDDAIPEMTKLLRWRHTASG
jgi:hypothetical protein